MNTTVSSTLPTKPQYCSQCSWFFSKMGACMVPEVSQIWSYLSLLPYLIIFALVGLAMVKFDRKNVKIVMLLVSAYLIGDRVLKNVIQSPRPEFSCKSTFGMPSSHMTVMVGFTYAVFAGQFAKLQSSWVKICLIALCLLQGVSRVKLNYHTTEQVVGGTMFALLYSLLFNRVFDYMHRIYEQKRRNAKLVEQTKN